MMAAKMKIRKREDFHLNILLNLSYSETDFNYLKFKIQTDRVYTVLKFHLQMTYFYSTEANAGKSKHFKIKVVLRSHTHSDIEDMKKLEKLDCI